MPEESQLQRVAIVGGGLAGLAAAVALSDFGLDVQLFEARRQLGGRAGSFRDDATGAVVDHCQHVSMGCCTNFADFCRRTGTHEDFERHSTLHFYSPDGRRFDLRAARWLPAPFHLAPSFLRLGFLSRRERLGIGLALLKLARLNPSCDSEGSTIGQWLRRHGQSENAIRRFWSVVLVSALGESLDRSSLAAARKVFVDGFLANRAAYHLQVPVVPLAQLYGQAAKWLRERGVSLNLASPVASLDLDKSGACLLSFPDRSQQTFDFVVLAVPWRQLSGLVPGALQSRILLPDSIGQIGSSPVTAVHLWFDRQITDLPHAVIVDRLSQWLFHHGLRQLPGPSNEPCDQYQIVISASQSLANRSKEAVLNEVLADLETMFPAAKQAELIRWQIVTQRHAVFSYSPGLDQIRPSQQTAIPNLFLAGDWTATGWPSTMESAVRSGYLAAEYLSIARGDPQNLLVDDLPRNFASNLLIRR